MLLSSSSAPEVQIHIDGQKSLQDITQITARCLIKLARPLTAQLVRVELVGEETVNLRAWVPLNSTTLTRTILKQQLIVYENGTLNEGLHTFPITLCIPHWVPSTISRDQCRIKYVVRCVLQEKTLLVGSGLWTSEDAEIECRRIKVSYRLARRKKMDQSVGCPDGSCHVRIWGTLSRDVVRPGAQVKVDVMARTSDRAYGIRVLGLRFAENVMCNVQVRGEERMVSRYTNLVSCRLDALEERGFERSQSYEETSTEKQQKNIVRKTKSKLAVLLGNSEEDEDWAEPANAGRVVRQVRATHVLQVPEDLSQFASEYVSRDYKLIVVAEVAPLADPDSTHTNDTTTVPSTKWNRARSPSSVSSVMSSSSPAIASSSSESTNHLSSSSSSSSPPPSKPTSIRRRGKSDVYLSPSPSSPSATNSSNRWSVSEQSSAIAVWPLEVVDRFDVPFDDLVSPNYEPSKEKIHRKPKAQQQRDAEILMGEYRYKPLDSMLSPRSYSSSFSHGSTTTESSNESSSGRHHRRTASNGLMGYLLKGFRSHTAPSSPQTLNPADVVLHRRKPTGQQRQHTRSASTTADGYCKVKTSKCV